jgi:hypothetical protein
MRGTHAWFTDVLARAPELTRTWGPFRAFLAIFGIVAMALVAIRPEATYACVGIFFVAVVAALIAAYKNWLN